MNGTLRRIEQLRIFTGECLAKAFATAKEQRLSEKALTDLGLSRIRQDINLYEDGWYVPPPHGIITIFGKKSNGYARVNQPSFRPESQWPKSDLYYDPEDIVLFYASPIDRKTGLIGDFGLSLYGGSDKAVKDHFETVLKATLHIAAHARPGMSFCELYEFAMDHGKSQGFQNNIESSADKTGTNIGHTIPGSFATDPACNAIAQAKTYDEVKDAIRANRVFVNGASEQTIEPDMAFTIEPRFSTDTMPNTMFHMTMIFEGRQKRICHGFRPIMERAGMDYLLKLLP